MYLHREVLIIHAERLAASGFKVATIPVFRLTPSALPEEVGATLRKALAGFQQGTPDPLDWKDIREGFLKATGLKSWKSLEGSPTRSCWVSEEDGKINFTPLKNGGNSGPKKGFKPFGREVLNVSSDDTDRELGAVLLGALKECE